MSDTVIRVENLGKKYIIGHQQQRERYTALRDVLTNSAKGLAKRFNPRARVVNPNFEEFWALKDVSFEVKRGDRIGIIGRNGAGKSTLLKILSRITEPTEGRVSIKGRVASLLEVGTGFHPELTGRENIYLNGAILGMSKREIRRKFDEIVAFAEIERFLDTPVKRYSSGMYVRLAFAVAAHLEPEILIVDEVLAVGDAQFQKKCLGKMENVGKEGRTVLFVSHNMGAIKSLCDRSIVLRNGKIIYSGNISEGINQYNSVRDSTISNYYKRKESHIKATKPYFKEIKVFQNENNDEHFKMHLPIYIYCEFEPREFTDFVVTVVVRNSQGDWLIHSTDEFSEYPYDKICTRKATIPSYLLTEGTYYMIFALGSRKDGLHQKLEDIVKFNVEFSGRMSDKTTGSQWKGYLAPGIIKWD
ncbi:polysaccharide/polyol phosphate ABC transporter ATP-binding protein [Picosynechococcus sp. PCC 7003]|uniref:ABC transporter ATP-binding protein n=1 Tax=Picosynechococcus sp. PCC 7003 TaxID=374981 RepID=UPI000810AD13|nr:ABC transporter ATP-binding protein [Picosynechococcus sp. PCC 7003]ANV84727.1 polysaccharide/polyol phosphate ABC transporter ATP-binding protein [Picosynechococcus sp. PCC 7003]